MHRQPGFDVFLRLVVEDVLAVVGAEVVLLALVLALAVGDLGGIVRLGEQHGDLAHLAQLRQVGVHEALALFGLLAEELEARAVVLVEGLRILAREPVELLVARHPGVEVGHRRGGIEGGPGLVGDVVLLLLDLLDAVRHLHAVAGQILEQAHAVLFEVDLPGFLPAHDALGQHVVHHHGDDGQQAHAAPGPLVDPLLHDGQVGRVLLEHELDDFQPQRHVTRFVGLGGEAEGHGAHVAVVGGARDEGHEHQVGQHVLEREADGDDEFEGAAGAGVFEEALGHRQVPQAVVHVLPVVEAVVEAVVVRQRVDLGLGVAQLVDGLHLAGHLRADTGHVAAQAGKAAVGVVFQRRHGRQEDLHGVDVARVGHVEVAVVLVVRVDDGVQLALFLGLVFPVRIHGQAEGVFPLLPVVNLQPFIVDEGEHILVLLVAGLPAEVTGHEGVFFLEPQFFLFNRHIHSGFSLSL